MRRRIGLALCSLGWHRWREFYGFDAANGFNTIAVAYSCERKCGIPMEIAVEREPLGTPNGTSVDDHSKKAQDVGSKPESEPPTGCL